MGESVSESVVEYVELALISIHIDEEVLQEEDDGCNSEDESSTSHCKEEEETTDIHLPWSTLHSRNKVHTLHLVSPHHQRDDLHIPPWSTLRRDNLYIHFTAALSLSRYGQCSGGSGQTRVVWI